MTVRAGDTDERLLEAWRARADREALEALLERLTPFALAVARSVSRPSAEDAVQDALLNLVERAGTFRPGARVRPWLARLVVNAAVSRTRGEARRRRREEVLARSAPPPVARETSPAETAERDRALADAIESLEPNERVPVVLHYQQGLTQSEVAEALGVTQPAVVRRLERARERLRRSLASVGFAGLGGGALAEIIASTGAEAVPAVLAAKVSAIAGGANMSTAGVGAAAAAAAKGGLAMKVVASIVAAGTLAGTVAVSTGALSGRGDAPPANVNPVTGRQSREEIYEFTQKPAVKKEGDKYVITFASKGKCDATVAILDGKGKVVRHLASGVLGANAPHPFKQNALAQSIEWDGTDDQGKKAPAGCKVKVSLGLKAEYERQMCFDPYDFPGRKPWTSIQGLACDDAGLLYVFGAGGLRAFDREGKYVRSLAPHPGSLKPEEVAAYNFYPTTYGDQVILCGDRYGPFNKGVSGTVSTAAYSPAAKKLLAFLYQNDSRVPSRLFKLGLNGAQGKEDAIYFHRGKKGTPTGYLGQGTVHVAATTDGKTVYLGVDAVPVPKAQGWRKGGGFCHAVYRFSIDALKGPDMSFNAPFLGEATKPGSDAKHFNGIGGLAVDKDGNVYVADRGNDRIQVYKPDGALLRSLKLEKPGQIYVHPKTGTLYCLAGEVAKKKKNTMKILKLSPEGKTLAALPLEMTKHPLEVQFPAMCLDPTAEPAALWVREIGGYLAIPAVFRIEDRGATFVKTVTLSGPDVTLPWNKQYGRPRMAVDRAREELYVISGRPILRFNGKTGERDEAFSKKKFSAESVQVGPDGLIYARVSGIYGPFVIRFNRDGSPVDFKHGVTVPRGLPKGFEKTKVIWTGQCSESNVHQKGFAIAPNGDVYAVVTGPRKAWLDLRTSGKPEPPDATTKFYFNEDVRLNRAKLGYKPLLRVWNSDGKEKTLTAAPGLPYVHGVRVDRAGCVYVASLTVRPEGEKVPDGLTAYAKFTLTMGSVLKFGDGGGKLPTATFWRDKDSGAPAGPNNLYDAGGWGKRYTKAWCDKLQWGYFGMTGLGVNCTCHHKRFDIDGYARAFIPAMHLFSVMVLDSNGNRILRLGRYGNADHQGPESLEPDPDIGFAWVRTVAASDTALYAMDYGNKRIVKAALSYEAEEEVPVP